MMDKLISLQQAIDVIKKRLFETAFNNVGIKQNIDETLVDVAENRLENWFDELPSVQPEQRWIPVTEIPPRGRDLMLKIHDACNSFFYYHMGFHDGEKYFTYNFFWQRDKDLEIVGWQLCPWEER